MKKPHGLMPQKTQNLTPDQYVAMAKNSSSNRNIESVVFAPPKAGSSGYGFFQVTYKIPQLVSLES